MCVVRERAVRLRRSRPAGEVVALVDRDDEQRVVLRDPVVREPGEERVERRVVGGQLLLVVGLARAGGASERVVVVRVGDVRERHRNAVLLHLRDLAEGVLGERPVEAGEAAVAVASVMLVPSVAFTHGLPPVIAGLTYFAPNSAIDAVVRAGDDRRVVRLRVRRVADRRCRLRSGSRCRRSPPAPASGWCSPRSTPASRSRRRASCRPTAPSTCSRARCSPPRRRRRCSRRAVYVSHGAGVVCPLSVTMFGSESSVPSTVSVQYLNERREGRHAVGRVVVVAVRDRLPVAVRVEARQRREDPARGVRDEDRVVVRVERPVPLEEVQEVRHLLEVRRDVAMSRR